MTSRPLMWLGASAMLALAAAIPVALVSTLIVLEHWGMFPMVEAVGRLPWELNVAVVILPGLIPVAYLRWPAKWRVVAGLLYFIGMFAIVPFYALVFSCAFTGDCI